MVLCVVKTYKLAKRITSGTAFIPKLWLNKMIKDQHSRNGKLRMVAEALYAAALPPTGTTTDRARSVQSKVLAGVPGWLQTCYALVPAERCGDLLLRMPQNGGTRHTDALRHTSKALKMHYRIEFCSTEFKEQMPCCNRDQSLMAEHFRVTCSAS